MLNTKFEEINTICYKFKEISYEDYKNWRNR